MADNLTPAQRSYTMSRVRSTDTTPELVVRRLSYALGYRHRLHRRDLPGTPDLVYPCRRKAIFVHGCFWHGHGCSRDRTPASNRTYWNAKRRRNKERDRRNQARLRALGWKVLLIWECELRNRERLRKRIISFLGEKPACGSAIYHRAIW
jgi:DNA mismatch endonuclease (patch repair protein)